MTGYNRALLKADASNRSVRTFLTGLAIDIAVGLALVLAVTFADANAWGDLEWAIIGFSFAKSIAQAVAAYVLRQFLDPSKLPTPLPPGDPGRPADGTPLRDEVGAGEGRLFLIVVVAVVVGLLLWALLTRL